MGGGGRAVGIGSPQRRATRKRPVQGKPAPAFSAVRYAEPPLAGSAANRPQGYAAPPQIENQLGSSKPSRTLLRKRHCRPTRVAGSLPCFAMRYTVDLLSRKKSATSATVNNRVSGLGPGAAGAGCPDDAGCVCVCVCVPRAKDITFVALTCFRPWTLSSVQRTQIR